MKLSLQKIELQLPDFLLAVDVVLEAPITALFGPSGAGKTSLLDLIVGLRTSTKATIALGERVLTDTSSGVCVPTHRRAIGYVPQDLALFPHLSVRSNLLYGHQAFQTRTPLDHVSETLELAPLLERAPATLSGGEKQRVALGRALLAAPELLLLDEPLASLDQTLKLKLLPYIRRIQEEFHVPLLYVTHDREEVLSLCDEVLVLERGLVTAHGSPEAVLKR